MINKVKISWPKTVVTDLLKINLPIIQAPMAGGATTPELVAAVANAGGLGSLGAGYLNASELRVNIAKIRDLTDKPFCINLFIPEEHQASDKAIEDARSEVQSVCNELNYTVPSIAPPYVPSFDEQIDVLIEEKIPIFSFTFGIPSKKVIARLQRSNVILIGTATTVAEALMLEKNGINAVIAQGSEAGGHRGGFLGEIENNLINSTSLVASVAKKISIPIIAAGGVMNAQGIFSLMTLGATAVQMGTAFLTCAESGIHPNYKKAIVNAQQDVTELTRAFSGKLARGISNKFIVSMREKELNILDYPIQNALTIGMRKKAAQKNNTDFMSMWAGQNLHLSRELSAKLLMQELDNEMQMMLRDSQDDL